MEPASILSVTAACLSVVVKTSKSLVDLVDSYRSVDNEISMVIVKLDTVRATISQLEFLLQDKQSVPDVVAADLNAALGACEFVVRQVHKHVERVKIGSVGGRIRHMFNETQYLQFQRSLDSQIMALGVLLSVLLLKSHNEQRLTLEQSDSRHLLREAKRRVYVDRTTDLDEDIISLYSRDENSSSTAHSPRAISCEEFDEISSPSSAGSGGQPKSCKGWPAREAQDGNFALDSISPISPSRTDDRAATSSHTKTARYKHPQRHSSRNGNRNKLTEELRKAVVHGTVSLTETLCQQGAEVNCRLEECLEQQLMIKKSVPVLYSIFGKLSHVASGNSKTTLLHHGAEKGQLQIIEVLVKHGANLEARAKGAKTPLHIANGEAAELLISLGASLSATDDTGAIPLHYMAAKGQLRAVEEVVQRRSSTKNATNKLQQTPLHLACQHGHLDTAVALLKAGGFSDAVDTEGLRPLHYAAKYGHDAITRVLLDHVVDAEAPAKDCWSPLHYAASQGHVDVVYTLIKHHSIDLNRPALGQWTALHMATANSRPRVVELLLSASANVEAETERGERPLHLAVSSNRYDIVEMMLQHGARVNQKTRDGTTPLLEACRTQMPPQDAIALVQLVLDNGARINARNCFGQTPISVACARPHSALSIVRLLLQKGARVRSMDYLALWRNHTLPVWEKKAVHAAFNQVANKELPKEEVEWLIMST